jgi:hypothetical protein
MYLDGGFKREKHRWKNPGKQAGRLWGGGAGGDSIPKQKPKP